MRLSINFIGWIEISKIRYVEQRKLGKQVGENKTEVTGQ
jgi:hypothetical protein